MYDGVLTRDGRVTGFSTYGGVWVLKNADQTGLTNQVESEVRTAPADGHARPKNPLVSQLGHLMVLLRVFWAVALAFVLVMSMVGWLRLSEQMAFAQEESDPLASLVSEMISRKIDDLVRTADRLALAYDLDHRDAVVSGWRIDEGSRQYYLADSGLAKGIIDIDGVMVTFDDEGNWISSRLDAPYISQLPDMPFGCEVVSVTMMLNYAGIDVTKEELAARMPYAGDPNEGFTGSLYGVNAFGGGGVIWPPALLELVRERCGSAVDLTGESWETVQGFIDQGRPVCVWFTSEGLDHTVLLTGYSDTTVWVNDPLADKDVTLDIDTFWYFWEGNGYRALSY
jgi:uncharacterized protein YvpB